MSSIRGRTRLVRKADGVFHGYVWPDKAVFPDFLRPGVREWWGDLHLSLTEIGAGIWNDMNEPALNDRLRDAGERFGFPMRPGAGKMIAQTMRKFTICMADDGSRLCEGAGAATPQRTLIRADKIASQVCSAGPVWIITNHCGII